MRLIDADKLLFSLEEWEINETPNANTYPKPKEFTAYDMQRMIWRTIINCESAVEEQPTVKAIPIELYKQVKGERDVAIEQLKSLNVELFEKPYRKAITIEWLKAYEAKNGQETRLQEALEDWEKETRLQEALEDWEKENEI